MDETPLCTVWCRGGGADADAEAEAEAEAPRSQMPIEDEERICSERKGSPCRGCTRARSAALRMCVRVCVSVRVCDREPGAVRLAAVEPYEADG